MAEFAIPTGRRRGPGAPTFPCGSVPSVRAGGRLGLPISAPAGPGCVCGRLRGAQKASERATGICLAELTGKGGARGLGSGENSQASKAERGREDFSPPSVSQIAGFSRGLLRTDPAGLQLKEKCAGVAWLFLPLHSRPARAVKVPCKCAFHQAIHTTTYTFP